MDDSVMETRPSGSLAGFDSQSSKDVFGGTFFDDWDDTMNRPQKYKAHALNLREIESAHTHLKRQLNHAVSSKNVVAEAAFLKVYVLLLGAWAEVRLLKVLHEPNGFADADVATIMSENSLLNKWKMAVYLGFCRRYGVNTAPTELNIGFDAFSKYDRIQSLLDGDLRPIIEIRNKLAHGQWARPFNNDLTEISQERMQQLNTENPLSCKFKKKIIECIANLINDLVVGGEAFERDFDVHYRLLLTTTIRLEKQNYGRWRDQQTSKFRGHTA